MELDFLKNVTKDLEKAGLSAGEGEPPRYWFSTGNHVLNKIISGSYMRGIPQGRLTAFSGPSGAGKSFLASNAMREAQKQGAHIVVIDSENALDSDFVSAIGVDPTKGYNYFAVSTIPQVKKIVSSFLTGYAKEYGNNNPDAPKLLFVIDSLDMLMTETEEENFESGVTKGDQGQRNKQMKAMLRSFVQAIKSHNISMIVTSQVYRNQDVTNGEGVWIVSDAVKYSLSQIVLITKLKLKDKASRDVQGIRMKCEGYKTRFTKPYQTVTIEVPYESGMDPYNGLLDVAIEVGVVQQKGAWCYLGEDAKWNGKVLPPEHAESILQSLEGRLDQFLEAMIDDSELDLSEAGTSARSRRQAKATAAASSDE